MGAQDVLVMPMKTAPGETVVEQIRAGISKIGGQNKTRRGQDGGQMRLVWSLNNRLQRVALYRCDELRGNEEQAAMRGPLTTLADGTCPLTLADRTKRLVTPLIKLWPTRLPKSRIMGAFELFNMKDIDVKVPPSPYYENDLKKVCW